MRWFRRKPTQQEYVEAAIKVASHLYLQTIPGATNAFAPLRFGLPDSRYRYLIFCIGAVVTAALAYDEKKQIQPTALIDGCVRFVTWTATENAQEYFDDPANNQESINNVTLYLQEFLKRWSQWPALEKAGRNSEIIDLISSMLHTIESKVPAQEADKRRLGELSLQIDCQLPTMRGAFIDLASG